LTHYDFIVARWLRVLTSVQRGFPVLGGHSCFPCLSCQAFHHAVPSAWNIVGLFESRLGHPVLVHHFGSTPGLKYGFSLCVPRGGALALLFHWVVLCLLFYSLESPCRRAPSPVFRGGQGPGLGNQKDEGLVLFLPSRTAPHGLSRTQHLTCKRILED
jgi:hypothetical protein